MKIYLDDVRPLPPELLAEGGWTVIRTAEECIQLLRNLGLEYVEWISFDHDLGDNAPTGYDVAKWIEREVLEHGAPAPGGYWIHSQNPVGVRNIEACMGRLYG